MPRILLVEDDEMNRAMLARRLQLAGFDVAHAADGQAGLAAAQSENPDLIGMDLGLRILVVEDNEANREMLRRRLLAQGYAVSGAGDGREALALVKGEPFDLILCDIMMPELDGYQVLEALKADPHLREIPVIMISALDAIDSVVRCISMGADHYLFKPFDPVLLQAGVTACLEKKRLRDQELEYL